MKTKLIIIILILLASCSKFEDEMQFRIKAGKHYADNRSAVKVNSNRIDFEFYVHPSWRYEPGHDVGWSKMIGLSHGIHVFFSHGISPHPNSARIAWRCRNGEIHLAGYYYINHIKHIHEHGKVEYYKWYQGSIEFDHDRYTVTVNGVTSFNDKYRDTNATWLLFPYFGGELPAQHDTYFYFRFL
jgi:hypothetical protein